MKFLVKILIGFITIIAVIIASIFLLTSGMPKVADEYLELIKARDYKQANSYLSSHIRPDAQALLQYVQDNSMDDMVDTSWSNRAFVNNNGSISGEITTSNNETIDTRIAFIKEAGDWKIYSIQRQANSAVNVMQQPANAKQVELAHTAMKVFMLSANEKSMNKFYNSLSSIWQRQTTAEELNKAFSSALKFNGDFTFLDNIKPVIDFASIIAGDVLLLSGSFNTGKETIYFSQKYLYEGIEWKLVAFEYSSKK